MRILVADDSPDFAALITALGRASGHEVFVASSGQQAIEAAAAQRPDVAFIDLTLSDLSGGEVAAAIARTYQGQVPVLIACSGRDPADPAVRAALPHFADYLLKGRAQIDDFEKAIASAAYRAGCRAQA